MSKGSIYILKNPAFREANMLKIGRTERPVGQRAKKLFTTGLPDPFDVVYEQDVPECVLAENLVHEELKDYRYRTTVRTILNRQRWNAGFSIITEANTNGGMRVSASASKNVRSIDRKEREFFVLPVHEAIAIIQKVIQKEFYKIFSIPEETYFFNKGITLRQSFQFKGIILLTSYKNIFAREPSIINKWWCKPKDHILITNRISDAPEEFVKLASESCVAGSLSNIINIYPGDRLAIIEASNTKGDINQLSLFENPASTIRIVNFREYARMVGFMENIEIHPSGFPIPFGASEHEDVPVEDLQKAWKKIIALGMPRSLPVPDYTSSLKSGFDYYT